MADQFDKGLLSQILARAIFQKTERNDYLALCTPVYCPDIKGVKADKVTTFRPKYGSPKAKFDIDSDLIEINLDTPFQCEVEIPYGVELKTEYDVLEVVKAYFWAQFGLQVNEQIRDYIEGYENNLKAGADYEYSNNAELLANVASYLEVENIGNIDRVYKYDFGAPVVFTNSLNEFDTKIPFDSQEEKEIYDQYLVKVNTNTLYDFSSPLIVFRTLEDLKSFNTDLASKTISEKYACRYQIGYDETELVTEGVIVGKKDNIALCYTKPRIAVLPSSSGYKDKVKCEIDYGFAVINKPIIFNKKAQQP